MDYRGSNCIYRYKVGDGMTHEKALITALKIVSICKKYSGEDRCGECPFNLKGLEGCFITHDCDIPMDWPVADLTESLKYKMLAPANRAEKENRT